MTAITHQGGVVMTVEKAADQAGVSHGTMRGWVERGYVPSVRIGARRVVNVVAWVAQLAAEAEAEAMA